MSVTIYKSAKFYFFGERAQGELKNRCANWLHKMPFSDMSQKFSSFAAVTPKHIKVEETFLMRKIFVRFDLSISQIEIEVVIFHGVFFKKFYLRGSPSSVFSFVACLLILSYVEKVPN